jgi:hypothetical protein
MPRHTLSRTFRVMLGLCTLGLELGGCSGGLFPHTLTQTMTLPAPEGWHDGSYTGTSDRVGDLPTPQFVRVTIDVAQGQIVTVRVHQPPEWQAPPGLEELLPRILAQPTPVLEPPPPVGRAVDPLRQAIEDAGMKARMFTPTPP